MFSAKHEANETGLSIIYKDKILQSFKKNEFCKCLSTVIAIYFVFNRPFGPKVEKSLGLILEALDFTEQIHYDTRRSVNHLKLLESLKKL